MIFGVDVSHWEGTINWPVASRFIGFSIHKATEGTSFTDDTFAMNKAGCQNNGVPWGAYHYFHPTIDAVAQARHFVNVVGPGCLVYSCDVETAIAVQAARKLGVRSDEGLVKALASAKLKSEIDGIIKASGINIATVVGAFLEEVRRLVPGQKRLVVYSSPYFWNTYMRLPNGQYPDWNGVYDLWIAHYGVEHPIIPKPWAGYKMHQFSDRMTVVGIPTAVDGDWYNGTQEELVAYFGNGQVVPPTHPDRVVVTATAGLRLREAGTTESYHIATVPFGKELAVEGVVFDPQGRPWYKVTGYVASWLTKPK